MPTSPVPGIPSDADPSRSTPAGDGRAPGRPVPPPAVRRAAVLVLVQGAVLAGFGVLLAIETVVSRPASVSNALAVTVVAVGAGLLLGWLARALFRLRTWARTPVVVLELVSLPVGVTMMQAGRPLVGGPILLLAAAVLALLFSRPARAVLDR